MDKNTQNLVEEEEEEEEKDEIDDYFATRKNALAKKRSVSKNYLVDVEDIDIDMQPDVSPRIMRDDYGTTESSNRH